MTGPDDLERRLLQALCSEGAGNQEHEIASRGLAGYVWREPVHQAIFEIVMGFPPASSRVLREQVPARLTRRGFPDFDFESLFDAPGVMPDEVEHLIGALLGKVT